MLANGLKSFTQFALQEPLKWTRNMSVVAKSLKYSKFGSPVEVLQVVEDVLPPPKDNEVLVKIQAAPINPSDILSIEGTYPSNRPFPAIAGNECVGVIAKVGSKVTKVKVGQRVIPFAAGKGTWTTHGLYAETAVVPISEKISIVEAATIVVNPCTAYRMLKDYVKLAPGDVVMQNGANSAVGQAVHQLCRAWGFRSVGVVRDRADIATLKAQLKGLGATEVLTEEELRTTQLFKEGGLPRPRLVFDCVGGDNSTELTRHVADKGTVVVYGSMSRQPVIASTALLIFRDVIFRGFWLTIWIRENYGKPEHFAMFDDLCALMEQGKLAGPAFDMVPLASFKEGAAAAALTFKGYTNKKCLFKMD